MHPSDLYDRAVELHAAGVPFGSIWRELDLPKGTVAHWLHGKRAQKTAIRRAELTRQCFRCVDEPSTKQFESYAYLLGQYLGDGHLVTSARVPVLRIYCTASYPDIIEECRQSMLATLAKATSIVRRTGCVAVQSYSKHCRVCSPSTVPV